MAQAATIRMVGPESDVYPKPLSHRERGGRQAGVRATAKGDVERILAQVAPAPRRSSRPALAVLVGLPGSGKSTVAEVLRARMGCVVLESDALRRLLVARPTYSSTESRRLFEAIHEAIAALLAEGVSVVLDATNVAESERAPLYDIAEQANARLVLVQVTAPEPTIRRRLAGRHENADGGSDANLDVYERMQSRVEEIQRPHHLVDTSKEVAPVLDAVAKEMMGT